jgi:hypothetical protein
MLTGSGDLTVGEGAWTSGYSGRLDCTVSCPGRGARGDESRGTARGGPRGLLQHEAKFWLADAHAVAPVPVSG